MKPSARTALYLAIAAAAAFALQRPRGLAPDEATVTETSYSAVPIVASRAELVEVAAVVRKGGEFVGDLARNDFEIKVDGKPVPVASFDVIRAAPTASAAKMEAMPVAQPAALAPAAKKRYVLIFADDFNTKPNDIFRTRKAVLDYARANLNASPNVWVGIAASSSQSELGFTRDADAIAATANKFQPHPRGIPPDQTQALYQMLKWGGGAGTPARAGSSPAGGASAEYEYGIGVMQAQVTYDSLRRGFDRLAAQDGDRVLVIVSDGIFSADLRETTNSLINRALKNHITINSIDAKGVSGAPSMSPTLDVLADMAYSTGGNFIYNNNNLSAAVASSVSPPPVTYMLAFQPLPPKPLGQMHTIAVHIVDRGGMEVESRSGYYSPGNVTERTQTVQDATRRAMHGEAATAGPAEALTVQPGSAPGVLALTVHIAPGKLPLQKREDSEADAVIVSACLAVTDNVCKFGSQLRLDLQMHANSANQFRKNLENVGLEMHLLADPGDYPLKVVIGEINQGNLAVINARVHVN